MITPDTPEEKILSEEKDHINRLREEAEQMNAAASELRELEDNLSGLNDPFVQLYMQQIKDKESSL